MPWWRRPCIVLVMSPQATQWKTVMEREYDSLMENRTWIQCDLQTTRISTGYAQKPPQSLTDNPQIYILMH